MVVRARDEVPARGAAWPTSSSPETTGMRVPDVVGSGGGTSHQAEGVPDVPTGELGSARMP
ncbi:hypothetical protein PV646_07170 [Streptomyces sp. ID05-26A]|nr:hypothetical protein [Streptomyces sp. ID05-26A]